MRSIRKTILYIMRVHTASAVCLFANGVFKNIEVLTKPGIQNSIPEKTLLITAFVFTCV
jgi:hypothetical protein